LSARAPRALRVEWQVDPIGLGTRWPRFFWQLAPGPGSRQSAYELLVARDEATLARDEGDLFASGRVAGDANAHVEYRGRELRSRERACWKVRIHDGDGNVSPWSAVARFEIGLLERADWRATWIASPLSGGPMTSPPVPALRREFALERPVERARLYVAALGLYEIAINGRRVGDHELSPGWTDFGVRTRWQAFDVTGHLVGGAGARGANAIGALLGDGWFCGFVGLRGARRRSRPSAGRPPGSATPATASCRP